MKFVMCPLTVLPVLGALVPAKNNSSFLWGCKAKTALCTFCRNVGLSWNRSANEIVIEVSASDGCFEIPGTTGL
ncbi:hypothetical protein DSO57_1020719 [Entomophthora muscae]|uniref:Uncharacterized protein n=1 Tax=Entomophthora muscae TaxID=34485 RepID=A0ACC2UDE8_9FUNG|nr:hypothetical protein DSO57_1020719 [Entomophthora muscae]